MECGSWIGLENCWKKEPWIVLDNRCRNPADLTIRFTCSITFVFFVFFSLFLFLFKLFCHVQQSCFVCGFTVWGLRATWPHCRLHRADWGGLNLLIFLLIFSALLQGNHFSGISGNVEMSGISSMSGKDQEKGPKSGKGQEFCAVGKFDCGSSTK